MTSVFTKILSGIYLALCEFHVALSFLFLDVHDRADISKLFDYPLSAALS